jgi:hypothetical protein
MFWKISFLMDSLPPVSSVYLAFFSAALVVLLLIAGVKLPETFCGVRRFLRQMGARKTRSERMLADLEKLISDARRLEGVYRFDSIEPHVSPGQAEAEAAVASRFSKVVAR